ncbi:hypothetical protein FHETE_3932 [Fusarium heterosporum]|uniref:Reverse transcriptase domain-containing protein n=1 Tax=Fusarium heterosporum TaxID=42747 RepID=A0A8H5TMF7_FUSHE|nr:hypothetical protein FHETE_3932 [Fusarium heterosporum]
MAPFNQRKRPRKSMSGNSPSFIIYQANVKNSPGRVYRLRSHVNGTRFEPCIIALQDPPALFPWMPFPGYKPYWTAARPLTADDHPNQLAKKKKKPVKLHGVASLSMSQFRPKIGECITTKIATKNWSQPKARKLCAAHKEAGLQLLTSPGAPTFARSIRLGSDCATIDLTFASRRLSNRSMSCRPLDVRGLESDHAVIQTVFSVHPTRDTSTARLWKSVDEEKLQQSVKKNLTSLHTMSIENKREADNFVQILRGGLSASIEECVPTVLRNPASRYRQEFDESVRKAMDQDKKALDSRSEWRLKTVSMASNPQGIHKLSRVAERLSKPKQLPQVPDIHDETDIHRDDDGKLRCVLNAIWPETSEGKDPPPPLKPRRINRRMRRIIDTSIKRGLEKGEISSIILGLSRGKAAGCDGIANEALQLVRDIVTPHLEHLFNACLHLGYHPRAFRHADTTMIPKEGKPLHLPGSWRPIALLSCVGKVLEKVVTNRLQLLVTRHNLLPRTQYGLPGKSTTTAIQYVLNPVYAAWTMDPKLKVTILSIDIKGAYDRVNRVKLLRVLQDFGVPEWIVEFVASFLSARSIVMRLPGMTSNCIWVNIGIPQGSPISPILFLFYTAPMLSRISNEEWKLEHPDPFSSA